MVLSLFLLLGGDWDNSANWSWSANLNKNCEVFYDVMLRFEREFTASTGSSCVFGLAFITDTNAYFKFPKVPLGFRDFFLCQVKPPWLTQNI